MRKQIQALGRLKTGQMNKTESAYCQHLELRKRAGEIVWYRFEGIKLRLADNTFYTPDFCCDAHHRRDGTARSERFLDRRRQGENQSRRRSISVPNHRGNG